MYRDTILKNKFKQEQLDLFKSHCIALQNIIDKMKVADNGIVILEVHTIGLEVEKCYALFENRLIKDDNKSN